MAQELKSVSVANPGFLGLNTQQTGVGLDVSWASEASNCIISKDGGIESRKGYVPVSNPITGTNKKIKQIHEYIDGQGVSQIHSFTADYRIYKGNAGTLTDISPATLPSPIDPANYKVVNFNNRAYAFYGSEDPLEYSGSGIYTKIKDGAGFLDSSDAVITTLRPHECLAAFGRLWVGAAPANKMQVWWSDALLGRQWSGGSSGTLDLRSVLTQGMDTITALRAWNGNLVIFLTKNILIYSGAQIPSTMVLVENITGIGCIARDSIQEIGTDLIFLSDSGIRSLGRSIQEKSLPISDLSKNVRDDLRNYINQASIGNIRSVYSEIHAFYILSVPNETYTTWRIFCLDLRRPLDDGSYRVTIWDSINPYSMEMARDGTLYIGKDGYLAKYFGYLDNTTAYRMIYFTPWIDFSDAQEKFNKLAPNYSSFIKIPKKLDSTITANVSSTFTFKWFFDYTSKEYSNQVITTGNVVVAEYNTSTSEYGISEWAEGNLTFRVEAPLFGSGRVLKFGLETNVNGAKAGIQRLDILAKLGRML